MIASWWFRRAGQRSLTKILRSSPTQLNLNALEDRTTPAGNVTAFVGNGILYVVGDAADNQVWISGTGKRSVIVQPLGDTTVNGSSQGVWLGDIRGYHIEDQSGNNTIVVSGLNTRGTLNVRTGGGDDQLNVLNSRVRQGTSISTGAGDDSVQIANSRLRQQTSIDTGAGNDDVRITNSKLRQQTTINLGDGNDTLSAAGSTFGRHTFISGGSGNNAIGLDGVNFRGPAPQIQNFQQSYSTILPKANNDRGSVTAGQATVVAVAANDVALSGTLDLSSIVVTSAPTFGTVVANDNGTVTYTANSSASETDTFRYTIRSSTGAVSNEATVTITVSASAVVPPTVPPVSPPVTPPTVDDTTAPIATLTSTAAETTNVSPIPFTVTFDEDVTGLSSGGIVVTNGVVVGFTAVDARTYTFGVTPTGQGVVTATVSAGAAQDAASNASTASATVSRTYDSVAPTVTANTLVTNNTTPTLTGTVDDSTATVQVTVDSQTVMASVSGSTWSATLPTALNDGTYVITVTATDVVGNAGTSTLPGGLVIDTVAPTATVTSSASEPTSVTPIPFQVTFSEDITGFTAAGLVVTNGTVTGFTAVDATTYTFGVTPTSAGVVSVSVASGAAQDAAGNQNTASTAITRTFSTGTIALTANTLVTNDTTPTLTGTVDDSTATVLVTVGSETVTATVTGNTWEATLSTALSEGTYNIVVNASTSGGKVGNLTETGGLVIDLTAPIATVSITATSPTNLASIPFTVSFNEAVTGFSIAGLSVTNGTASNFIAVNSTTYTFTVTPTSDGVVTVQVLAGSASDSAGNTNPASTVASITSDQTAPTVDVTSTSTDPTDVNPIPVTVTFSDDVTGFSVAKITVTNGSVISFVAVDATTYTFAVVPSGTGTVEIVVAAGVVTDAAGNANLVSNTFTRQFTGTVVTPTVSTTATSPTNLSTIPFTIVFDDDVIGFNLAGVTVTNGTASNFVAIDARTYTIDVTPTADGTITVTIGAGAANGPDGAPTATGVASIVSDRTAPTGTLTTTATNPTNLATIPFTLTFSEDVTGVSIAALSSTNGTITNFVAVDARTYTFDVVPTADGEIVVSLAVGVATDPSGNTNLATSAAIISDQSSPITSITTTASDPTSLATIPFTVTFSEVVTGLTLADVTVTNGTASNFQSVNGSTYTFDVTPTADGLVTVSVPAGAAQDTAGNPSLAGSLSVMSERFSPTATITSTATNPTNLTTVPVTITFSEDVTGFDETKVVITNGFVSNFVAVNARVYTFDVDSVFDGLVTVDIAAGAAQDSVGNPSVAASFSITVDATLPSAPIVTGLTPATESGPSGSGLTNVTSPTLVGTAEADATVTVYGDTGSGPLLLGITTADGSGNWTFTPSTPFTNGTITITATATDAAGNVSAASTPFDVTIDTVAPIATLSTTATSPTKLASIPFTVTFDVDTPGFTESGLAVTNGSISNFTKVDNQTYTFDVIPTSDGVILVSVLEGASIDAAGNVSSVIDDSIVSDQSAPITNVTTTANNPTNLATIPFTVTFSEVVFGFTLADVTVTNGTPSNLQTVSGSTYTFDVTPTADGPVTVTIDAGSAADIAGNLNLVSPTITMTSDQTSPTVAIDLNSTGAITGTAFDATTNVTGVAVSLFDGTSYWDGSAFASASELFFDATSTDGFATWSYAFSETGTFSVRTRVTDHAGNEDFSSVDVTVS